QFYEPYEGVWPTVSPLVCSADAPILGFVSRILADGSHPCGMAGGGDGGLDPALGARHQPASVHTSTLSSLKVSVTEAGSRRPGSGSGGMGERAERERTQETCATRKETCAKSLKHLSLSALIRKDGGPYSSRQTKRGSGSPLKIGRAHV